MSVEFERVRCGKCGKELEESLSLPVTERTPCPDCGSTSRQFAVAINETLKLHSKLSMKGRRPGMKRPFVEQVSGHDLHRESGRWMILVRVIDRLNNWYHEVIKDPETDEVVHESSESLSDHKVHGSAKKAKKKRTPS